MTTLQAEQDAVRDFLAAGWTQGRTYDVGAVPANPVTPYRVVSVLPADPRGYRLSSVSGSRFVRVAVQHFGRNVDEVMFASDKTEATLLDKRPMPGASRARREVATPVTRDADAEGLLQITHTYTYTRSA